MPCFASTAHSTRVFSAAAGRLSNRTAEGATTSAPARPGRYDAPAAVVGALRRRLAMRDQCGPSPLARRLGSRRATRSSRACIAASAGGGAGEDFAAAIAEPNAECVEWGRNGSCEHSFAQPVDADDPPPSHVTPGVRGREFLTEWARRRGASSSGSATP